jgi:hypothetical protein
MLKINQKINKHFKIIIILYSITII